MGKITVNMNLTLDGVMQAPGRADEDTRGGFKYGGWATPYFDPNVSGKVAAEAMARQPALIFGRRTYEDFYKVWPSRTDNPFTEVLNRAQKLVASTTLREPLPWDNSVLLKGDVPSEVARLKEEAGRDYAILGSGVLVQSLMKANLIDEFVLSIHPLVLGTGQRMFPDGSPYSSLKLVDTKTTSTGVIIATYLPAASKPV
jgi:dihydrofolate reductase